MEAHGRSHGIAATRLHPPACNTRRVRLPGSSPNGLPGFCAPSGTSIGLKIFSRSEAAFEEHTPETVLERFVEPAGGAVMQLAMAARRFQHGRVQSYLLYLLIGLAALAGLVLVGGGK